MLPLTFQTSCIWSDAAARNYPGLILMRPGIEHVGAIWAQECYEAMWKLRPWNALRYMFSSEARAALEVRGHEVEVQAEVMLEGGDAASLRAREAHDMALGYAQFEGVGTGEIFDRMAAQEDWAARWVSRRATKIRRMARRLGE